MVTRSEWVQAVAKAWRGEPCLKCGRPLPVAIVTEEGDVYAYCGRCDRDWLIAHEYPPLHVDPEPDENGDLPF